MEDSLQQMIAGAGSDNLFMQCETPQRNAFRPLPEGFSTRLCRRDELVFWKTMWAQGQYMEFMDYFYEKTYAPREQEFFQRCLFVVDERDQPVATSGIWLSYQSISTVLGLFVLPGHEGRGIGRGLFSEVMANADYPVYLHTHPGSVKAIKLYLDFGFKFVTDPVVGYRENNLAQIMPFLEQVFYDRELQTVAANPALLEAALLNESAEF